MSISSFDSPFRLQPAPTRRVIKADTSIPATNRSRFREHFSWVPPPHPDGLHARPDCFAIGSDSSGETDVDEFDSLHSGSETDVEVGTSDVPKSCTTLSDAGTFSAPRKAREIVLDATHQSSAGSETQKAESTQDSVNVRMSTQAGSAALLRRGGRSSAASSSSSLINAFDTTAAKLPLGKVDLVQEATTVSAQQHTTLDLPPMSPLSPGSAAAQHSPALLEAPQIVRSHLSLTTAPLSATLRELGAYRSSGRFAAAQSAQAVDLPQSRQDDAAPRFSVPSWARRSEHTQQRTDALQHNREAVEGASTLPRLRDARTVPTSPNGDVLSGLGPLAEAQMLTPPAALRRPALERRRIDSTTRGGRSTTARLSTGLLNLISGGGSSGTASSRVKPLGRSLPYRSSPLSVPSVPRQYLAVPASEQGTMRPRGDGWGGLRKSASWFPSFALGPLVSPTQPPSPSARKREQLRPLQLAEASACKMTPSLTHARAMSSSYAAPHTTAPKLRVRFGPMPSTARSSPSPCSSDDEWEDVDDEKGRSPTLAEPTLTLDGRHRRASQDWSDVEVHSMAPRRRRTMLRRLGLLLGAFALLALLINVIVLDVKLLQRERATASAQAQRDRYAPLAAASADTLAPVATNDTTTPSQSTPAAVTTSAPTTMASTDSTTNVSTNASSPAAPSMATNVDSGAVFSAVVQSNEM